MYVQGGGPQGAGEKSTPSGRSILKCDKAARVPPPGDKALIGAILSDKHHILFSGVRGCKGELGGVGEWG